jgi:hypothetical protein
VASYEIWRDQGDALSSSYTKLTNYDGTSSSYTLQTTEPTDGLGDPGTLYRILVRAVNTGGVSSEDSEALVVALGSVPLAPSTPTKNIAASGANQIAVDWTSLAPATLPLFGYRLYSDLGLDHDMTLVYDGLHQPTVTQFILNDVAGPLVTYKF